VGWSKEAVMTQALGVAVVGFGWMGRVHTQAYLRVPHHFPQLKVRPELVAVADEVPGRAEEAAAEPPHKWGKRAGTPAEGASWDFEPADAKSNDLVFWDTHLAVDDISKLSVKLHENGVAFVSKPGSSFANCPRPG